VALAHATPRRKGGPWRPSCTTSSVCQAREHVAIFNRFLRPRADPRPRRHRPWTPLAGCALIDWIHTALVQGTRARLTSSSTTSRPSVAAIPEALLRPGAGADGAAGAGLPVSRRRPFKNMPWSVPWPGGRHGFRPRRRPTQIRAPIARPRIRLVEARFRTAIVESLAPPSRGERATRRLPIVGGAAGGPLRW